MFTAGYWRQLYGIRRLLEGLVMQEVGTRLQARPAGPRDQGGDNVIFEPLAQATVMAISQQDYQFAIDIFHECFRLALEYENNAHCELHKGAMTFNVAIAYLRANDFPAAMHYFELAQHETRQTTGETGWGIYDSGLFQQNYWQILDLYEQDSPLPFYNDFWGVPFSSAAARQDWTNLSDHSKLLYIMLHAERISYRRLGPQRHMAVSESFGLSHWNLIADLARLLETELGHRRIMGNGLRSMITDGVNNSPVAGFKAAMNAIRAAHPVNNSCEFNTHFGNIRAIISGTTEPPGRRIAAAAYLAGVTRNQVQHHVDTGMIIFTDRAAAVFTAEVLLCLCRIDTWAR